jgi:hypothetical protein
VNEQVTTTIYSLGGGRRAGSAERQARKVLAATGLEAPDTADIQTMAREILAARLQECPREGSGEGVASSAARRRGAL